MASGRHLQVSRCMLPVINERGCTCAADPPEGCVSQTGGLCVAAQVYYFRRGSVKLANRNYQNVRSDYIIHMDSGCSLLHKQFCSFRLASQVLLIRPNTIG